MPQALAGMLIGAVDGLLLQYWLDPSYRSARLGHEFPRCPVQRHRHLEGDLAMHLRIAAIVAAAALVALPSLAHAAAPDADALLRAAFDNWRAKSSTTDITMTVHRPDWERSMDDEGLDARR